MHCRLMFAALLLLATSGCMQAEHPADAVAEHDDSWAVTAWGERYEVFAETDALAAGAGATSNAHVTILDGFAPLVEGAVAVVLRGPGPDQVFRQDRAKRDGIFPVEVQPATEGTYELFFRIDGPAGREEIAAGRVRVGTTASPGGTMTDEEVASGDISFLKEQQWRTAFATAPVAEATLNESLSAPARVTPTAGGEVTLTAAFNASVAPDPWPYPGLDVEKGKTVVRLLPRSGERSLPELQAEVTSLTAEIDAARRRVDRLTELLRVEATSAAELERARAALAGLEARLQSARQGVGSSGGQGTAPDGGTAIAMTAPWSGRVAEVMVTPGETVAAGATLARLVKVRPLWIVMALRPEDAARVEGKPAGLLLRRSGGSGTLEVGPEGMRLVSRAPEVDPRTASINLIVEVDMSASELAIGSSVEAELLLPVERRGIVVPASALVDDSGVFVAYVQNDGESFTRREVRVVARQGERALVEGLRPGERLVTAGGAAIRRSALLSSGAPEGHVH